VSTSPTVSSVTGDVAPAIRDVVVRGRSISREYGAGESRVAALRECDIDVRAGEMLVIVGKSGSGKSTLCNVLSGVDRPTSGTVTLLGHDIASLSDAEMSRLRATRIGFVLQRDNLVPWLTIEENVAAPLIFGGASRKDALAAARESLARIGLSHRATAWPSLVSVGEAQRAAVARACIGKPEVVFADEPTGALDRHNGELVRELFWTLVREQNAAAVLVTHDPDLAADSDTVVHLADGRIVAAPEAG
jgi:ABC-type lipoprotein export system ATPase subunit